MKVLIVNSAYSSFNKGGSQQFSRILVNYLKNKNIEVVVLTTGRTYREYYLDGVKIYQIKEKNLYWWRDRSGQSMIAKCLWYMLDQYNFLMKRQLIQVFQSERPDIIHTNIVIGISVAVWHVARSLKIPVLHTLHDYYLMCQKSTMFKTKECDGQCMLCGVYSKAKRKASNKISYLVGISNYIFNNFFNAYILSFTIPYNSNFFCRIVENFFR